MRPAQLAYIVCCLVTHFISPVLCLQSSIQAMDHATMQANVDKVRFAARWQRNRSQPPC